MSQPISFTRVKIKSEFWDPIIAATRKESLPLILQRLKSHGTWDAMRLRWKKGDPGITPDILWDSDIGKYVEAASLSLFHEEDAEMEANVQQAIDMIINAQQDDGYIGIYHTIVEPGKRWSSLAHNLELYGGGHILEAAITRHITLGYPKNDEFLEAMQRYVELVIQTFGLEDGQRHDYPGHQEIELALMRLYRITGDRRCVSLAQYFIEERGRTDSPRKGHAWDIAARARGDDPDTFFPYYWPRPRCYWHMQAHAPIRDQTEIVGHSVQAMYWLSSVVDVALVTDDKSYIRTVETLWDDMVNTKMYVTGGIGSVHIYEGFGPRYDLPNETSYAETCAAIGVIFLAQRLLEYKTDVAVTDILELSLYNAMLAGISLDGKTFNYDNPLATIGCTHSRSEWFKVFCCPSNICRLLNSLGGYIYAIDTVDSILRLTVHTYITSDVAVEQTTWTMTTEWPWQGKVSLRAKDDGKPRILRLRIPGWAESYNITLNGQKLEHEVTNGYASLHVRKYTSSDIIELNVPMTPRRLHPHPLVHQNRGCVAIRRGPLVYALESIDQDPSLTDLRLARINSSALLETYDMEVGTRSVVGIRTRGSVIVAPTGAAPSYTEQEMSRAYEGKPVELRFIPYFAWGNRGSSDMRVWIPETANQV